jgi:WD40 repeat protein
MPLPLRPISRRRVLLGLAGLSVAGGMIGLGVDAAIRLLKYSPTLVTYRGHSKLAHAVAWAPDGKRIASASDDGTVQVWEALTGKLLITYRGHNSGVQAAAWSPDSKFIVSSAEDGTVQVWNAASGQRILTYLGHGGQEYNSVYSVAWSPDGQYIVSGGDNTVQVWQPA